MKIRIQHRVLLFIIIILSSGCASIVSGTTQEMSFQSNPDGALVTVNGREIGKTPLVVQLKRGHAKPLTFSKEGYKTVSMQMDRELNPWFWGSIVCGGLYGSTTDGLSGAMHKYAPSQYMVTLSPVGTASIENHTTLSDNQKIKDFVVVSYRELQSDISKGKGPYLASLQTLLRIGVAESDAFVKKVKALSEAYPTIPEFADRVSDLAPKLEATKGDAAVKNEVPAKEL